MPFDMGDVFLSSFVGKSYRGSSYHDLIQGVTLLEGVWGPGRGLQVTGSNPWGPGQWAGLAQNTLGRGSRHFQEFITWRELWISWSSFLGWYCHH